MRRRQAGIALLGLPHRSAASYLSCREQGFPHGRHTDMALSSTHSHPVLDRIASGLGTLGHFAVLAVTAQPRVQAIEQLIRLSDEDLAARGTTREAELNHILGAGAAL